MLLDPNAPEGRRIKPLMAGLDLPHGLVVGIDHRIYASSVDKVFRIDPLADDPSSTIEVIAQNLPGLQPVLSDGIRLARNLHPLKPFVFDRHGNLYINIGAPSDNCATTASEARPCTAGEGDAPLAAVWMYHAPSNGVFAALKPGDGNPRRDIFARGLRNSMALAAHPQFPDPGFPLLQAENSRDLKDPATPNEELNLLEQGRHYGWPYCYDLTTESPEYNTLMRTSAALRGFCASSTLYRQPLLP